MSRKFSTNFSNESLSIKFPVGWQACRAVLLSVSDYAYTHTYVHVHRESNRQAGNPGNVCVFSQGSLTPSIYTHIYIHCIFLFKRVKSTTTRVLGTYIYTHTYMREICFPEYLRTYVYAFMYLMLVDQSFILCNGYCCIILRCVVAVVCDDVMYWWRLNLHA